MSRGLNDARKMMAQFGRRAQQQFGGLAAAFDKISEPFRKTVDFLGKLRLALGPVIELLGQMARVTIQAAIASLRLANAKQKLTFQLGKVAGDAQKGAQQYQLLQQLASDTGAEIDTLSKAFIGLRVSGSSELEAFKAVEAVANAATDAEAASAGLRQLRQIASRGIATQEDITTLNEWGFALKGNDRTLKGIVKEMNDVAKRTGNAEARAKDLETQFNRVRQTVNEILGLLSMGIAPEITRIAKGIADIAKNLRGINKVLLPAIGSKLQAIFGLIAKIISSVAWLTQKLQFLDFTAATEESLDDTQKMLDNLRKMDQVRGPAGMIRGSAEEGALLARFRNQDRFGRIATTAERGVKVLEEIRDKIGPPKKIERREIVIGSF